MTTPRSEDDPNPIPAGRPPTSEAPRRDAHGDADLPPDRSASDDPAAEEAALDALGAVREQIAKVIIGQDGVVTGLVTALLVRGHVLLEGVPGVAKTLLVTTLATALDLHATRVQFTPDLMPSDVTGQTILDADGASFRFQEGPVFTNLLLADEVNRTPPRTQAALLEAMQERQVSIGGRTRPLPEPFLVVATQNPVEHEGTYPLPEAQLDRFMFKLHVPYPTREQEQRIVELHDLGVDVQHPASAGVTRVAGARELAIGRAAVQRIQVEPAVRDYLVDLVRATRDSPSVELGVSPRGATMLLHAAKAWAWLAGRRYVTPDEIKAVAKPTLRHRIHVRPELELEGATADGVLDATLAAVAVPR